MIHDGYTFFLFSITNLDHISHLCTLGTVGTTTFTSIWPADCYHNCFFEKNAILLLCTTFYNVRLHPGCTIAHINVYRYHCITIRMLGIFLFGTVRFYYKLFSNCYNLITFRANFTYTYRYTQCRIKGGGAEPDRSFLTAKNKCLKFSNVQ